MLLDDFITSFIYLIFVFAVFAAAKALYGLINREFNLKEELLIKDNFAVALTVTGYYFGIVIALGGVIIGPSSGFADDLIDLIFYGTLSTIVMNISIKVNDKLILYKFDNVKEIVKDRNAGTGVVEFGNSVAVGLIIYGAVSGEGGSLITALVFWLLGLMSLVIAGLMYNFIIPYDIHEEIEKDNVAAGIAFAGVLIGMGNIMRFGLSGDFYEWSENLTSFASLVLIGLILFPVVRWLTDKILLPGENLSREIAGQDKPNLGAALVEAFSYIASSFLIGWSLLY